MHYILDFRNGPLVGQTLALSRRPASITITFDEGPTTIYVQDRLTKRFDEGFTLEMIEPDYDQVTPEEKTDENS